MLRIRSLVVVLLMLLFSGSAQAFQFSLGLSALEEGDEHFRPAAVLGLGTETISSRTFVWGREFGPVQERSVASAIAYNFTLFERDWGGRLYVSGGLSLLLEYTKIKPVKDIEKESATQFNLGAYIGFHYQHTFDCFFISVNWDSHLYFAGLSGLLMATGRKHMLGIGIGVIF